MWVPTNGVVLLVISTEVGFSFGVSGGAFIRICKHATAHGTCYQTANTDNKFKKNNHKAISLWLVKP
ncbi:hypothetical protein DIY08_18720 [Shewanella xiamenensis]|nr:hypothetical protein DIY08_18720 [Shewanella xiamenensis]